MNSLPIKTNLRDDFFAPEAKEIIVSAQTKRLWAVELDLLLEFDRVCKKNGLKYSIEGGTLIGAVRHGGFIPWDDDVDVIMLRSEYDKLCAIGSSEFKRPYFFQNDKTDPGCYRPHVQIRNSLTTCILKGEMVHGRPRYNFNQGVFMDVFVADEVPDVENERAAFLKCLVESRSLFYKVRGLKELLRAGGRTQLSPVGLTRFLLHYARFAVRERTFSLNLDKYLDQYLVLAQTNNKGFKQCGPITLNPWRRLTAFYDVSDFGDLIDVEFEGYKFPAFRMYDKILSRLYGNWHEHIVGGSMHGGLFVDVDKPYTEYLKK